MKINFSLKITHNSITIPTIYYRLPNESSRKDTEHELHEKITQDGLDTIGLNQHLHQSQVHIQISLGK